MTRGRHPSRVAHDRPAASARSDVSAVQPSPARWHAVVLGIAGILRVKALDRMRLGGSRVA